MKRRTTLFLLLSLLICATVYPAAAQDQFRPPPPCTADEVAQVADLAFRWGDRMNTFWTKTYDATPAGSTERMLDWAKLYQSFFTDEFPAAPDCIDGVAYGNNVGTLLNEHLTILAAVVLGDAQIATNTSDDDLTQALTPMLQLQGDLVKEAITSLDAYVTQLKTGTGIPAWLPACTADQQDFTTQLSEFEQTYSDLQTGLQAYLDGSTVDKDTYLAVIKLVADMDTAINANQQNMCAGIYYRVLDDVYKFGDTFSALALAQAAPAISGNDRFDTMNQWLTAVLNAYLNPTTVPSGM